MFLPNIIWIGLQLGKLSQKNKKWTFYWDAVYCTLDQLCGSVHTALKLRRRIADLIPAASLNFWLWQLK